MKLWLKNKENTENIIVIIHPMMMAVNQQIDQLFNAFISKVATTYSKNRDEVAKLADLVRDEVKIENPKASAKGRPKRSPASEQKTSTTPVLVEEKMNKTTLNKKSKKDLEAICVFKGLDPKGLKAVLINRILGTSEGAEEKAPARKTTAKKAPATILKKLENQKKTRKIQRNKWGNYEDAETSFVFNLDKKVAGKQGDDGSIIPLSAEDIEVCKERKFPYIIPDEFEETVTDDDESKEDEDISDNDENALYEEEEDEE